MKDDTAITPKRGSFTNALDTSPVQAPELQSRSKDESVIPLTADETDYLSHFFYQQVPSGRILCEDELGDLLLRANITVPPSVLSLFHDQFGGPDGVLCEEFLDMCSVVKTMDILLLTKATLVAEAATTEHQSNAEGSEESRELFGLFIRLQQSEQEAEASASAMQIHQQPQDAPLLGNGLHSAHVPAGALEAIRNRRGLLERLAATTSASVSHMNTPRQTNPNHQNPYHTSHHHRAQHSHPQHSPQDTQVVDATQLPILRAYDDAFASIAQLHHRTAAGPKASTQADGSLGQPRGLKSQDGIARRPIPADILVAALILMVESSAEVPSGTVHHWAIKRALGSFGLLEDDWNATRTLESLGCAVDDDDTSPAQGSSGGELFVDSTLYIPLDARRFCALLGAKKPTQPAGGDKQALQRSTLNGGSADANDSYMHSDVDEDMDGVAHIVYEMHSAAHAMRRRNRSADSDDSENDDDIQDMSGPGVRYVEDPLTGEVSASGATGIAAKTISPTIGPDEIASLAAVETDLFLSPQRKRRLDEVREFLMAQVAANTPQPHYHSARDSIVATSRRTPPPPGGVLFPPDTTIAPPAAALMMSGSTTTMAMKKSQRFDEDDESGRAATPDEGSLMASTARRHTMISSTTAPPPASPSAGGRSQFLHSVNAPISYGLPQDHGGASSSSATGSAAHRIHPFHHKLRQIILRRLQRLREHFAHHPFPVSRKAQLHTGLTPTALPLSFPRKGSLSNTGGHEGSGAFSLERNDSTFMLNKSSANATALRLTSDDSKAQLAILNDAFPPCDMSYAEFYFVPQLKRAPRGGVPLHVASRTPYPTAKGADTTLDRGTGIQVVPGVYSDVVAKVERRYRTATNASEDVNNSGSLSTAHSTMAQTHNKRILLHSYLSPKAVMTGLQRSTTVDDSDGWVQRLSKPKPLAKQHVRQATPLRNSSHQKVSQSAESIPKPSIGNRPVALASVQRALALALADMSR